MMQRWKLAARSAYFLTMLGCTSATQTTPAQAPTAGDDRKLPEGKPRSGRLAPAEIQQVVRVNFGHFRRCYEDELRHDPHLQGRFSTHFVIEPDGTVSHVSRVIPSDGYPDILIPRFETCMLEGFSKLVFPKPEDGPITVTYPIIFNPGD